MFGSGSGNGIPNLGKLLGVRLPGPPKHPPKVPRPPKAPTPSGPGCSTGPDLTALGKKKGKR